jgi:hypothetical protein
LYRLTFSRSLLEHMNASLGNQYEIKRFKIIRGRILKQGESSSSGLYAIISTRKDKILRIAMNQAHAEFLCDFKSRQLQEVTILLTN